MNFDYSHLVEPCLDLVKQAGDKILAIYNAPQKMQLLPKADGSPLTNADLIANEYLCAGLKKLAPQIPIISEEGESIDYAQRQNWEMFWLLDPLDGTSQFVKRSQDFVINLALVYKNQPIFGIIYAPCTESFYFNRDAQAYKRTNQTEKIIHTRQMKQHEKLLILASSRIICRQEFKRLLAIIPQAEVLQKGSALKMALIAEGLGDLYLSFGATCEWDTAAGQAILAAAGGDLLGINGNPLIYNKVSLVNSGFAAVASKNLFTELNLHEFLS